jgi:hypothetical protein
MYTKTSFKPNAERDMWDMLQIINNIMWNDKMTLEEQFKKETGIRHEKNDDERDSLIKYEKYADWLEEKLTWKKFDGTIESFPCVVKYKNGVTRMYNSKIVFDFNQKSNGWEINRYFPIPPIQDDI